MRKRRPEPAPTRAKPVILASTRYWDMASTDLRPGADPDETAACRMDRTEDDQYYLLDLLHGRWSPGKLDRIIRETALADGPDCIQVFEQEGGASGKSIIYHYQRLLAGIAPVFGDRPTGSKVTRAMTFASYAEGGRVKLLRGPWNAALRDQLKSFPNGNHDDQVDACTGAYNWLANLSPEWLEMIRDGLLASGGDDDDRGRLDDADLQQLPDYLREIVQQAQDGRNEQRRWRQD